MRMRPMSSRVSLPDDVLLVVCTFLDVQSILSLRLTCKQLEKVTRIRWLWHDALDRHVLSRKMALPKPIADLKRALARDLERSAVRATRLDAAWSATAPSARHHIRFDASELAKKAGVELGPYHGPHYAVKGEQLEMGANRVLCLPGKGGELLVTVLDGRHLVVWRASRGAHEPTVLSHWSAPRDYERVEVVANEDLESEGTLAVTCALGNGATHRTAHPTAYIFHIDPFEGSLHLLASIPRKDDQTSPTQRRPLWSFRGDFVLLDSTLRLWNWRLEINELINRPGTGPIDASKLIAANRLGDSCLVMVEEQTLILAPIMPLDPNTRIPLVQQGSSIGAIYPFPFAATRSASLVIPQEWHDFFSMPPTTDHPKLPTKRPDRPLTVITCEHMFGTPDFPVQAFLSRLDFAPLLAPSSCTQTSIPQIIGWRFAPGVERAVLPSAGSPRMGPSGRGVFLETRRAHGTEDDRRLAPPVVRAVVGIRAPPATITRVVPGTTSCEGVHPQADDSGHHCSVEGCEACAECILGDRTLDVHEGELYARRCATGELARRQYRLSAVDFEDAAGRVVVGNNDGWVEVMDFA